jgi:GH15 family glucan-1,4-alpha-glucosidase
MDPGKEIRKSTRIMQSLRTDGGLYMAASCASTGYHRAWIRDNLYCSMGLDVVRPRDSLTIIHRLFDLFLKHEYKIDWAIREKPQHAYQYIHARYDPATLGEVWDEWGNKQNDAVGLFLFRTAEMIRSGRRAVRGPDDMRILRKLVRYLGSIRYWEDRDHGFWEKEEEVHASSVGACLAGLLAISRYVRVPDSLIRRGREALDRLLPRESETKETDLALLSLIYPYNVVKPSQREAILRDVEKRLVRSRGVIRHAGDCYYNRGGEAEWTMGFPWLAIIHARLGNMRKYRHYIRKSAFCSTRSGEMPELYFSDSPDYNENTPIGYSHALYLVALGQGNAA